MKNADKNIPPQVDGRHTDFTDSVALPNASAAHEKFNSAKAKMLDVSNWHNYSGFGSAGFGLCNDKGILLHRLAQTGDHFYVNLPATPGPDAGDGLEWVVIEQIIEEGNAESLEESITMIVRPTTDPRNDSGEIAHFFSDASTSTFIVARYDTKVSAEVHGRNEKPNNQDVDLHDTVRNTILALSARIGLSGMQWQKLVNGLLE
jgi:hypothetical protein